MTQRTTISRLSDHAADVTLYALGVAILMLILPIEGIAHGVIIALLALACLIPGYRKPSRLIRLLLWCLNLGVLYIGLTQFSSYNNLLIFGTWILASRMILSFW